LRIKGVEGLLIGSYSTKGSIRLVKHLGRTTAPICGRIPEVLENIIPVHLRLESTVQPTTADPAKTEE
jgi:hypothetical protein